MKEKAIVNAIRRYLKEIGAKVVKTHGSVHGQGGTPDIIGVYQGRALALEVKCPGKKLTPLQEHELSDWEAAGAIAARVESAAQVKELLNRSIP